MQAKVVFLQEPQDDCDVEVSITPPDGGDDDCDSLLLYATFVLLFDIPYFQTLSLREAWQQSEGKPGSGKVCTILMLECPAYCSPDDYLACFKFLVQLDPPEMLIKSILAAAKIMRYADHLLFEVCADKCMKYLAAAPWSEEEERAIRDAVSGMGLPLSPDLAARLDPLLDEFHIFKEFPRLKALP
ncbi:hypothetical protein L7F22_005082 [Adiantum nelumboides]|nr:hypothetical protein [Adiantum nelumboides]